jgi:hypothetical protein
MEWTRGPRNKPMQLQSSDSQQRGQKHILEKKQALLTNGAGKTVYPHVEDLI